MFKSLFIAAFIGGLTIIVSTAEAEQGPSSGNGGKGVIINGRPYLLDLVEAGRPMTPYFNPNVKTKPAVLKKVSESLGHDPTFPVQLIAQKISELMEREFVYGFLMLKTMELFEWNVASLPVSEVNDPRYGVKVEHSNLVQVALRLKQMIIFDPIHFAAMDPANRAATVLHELTYAFARPIRTVQGYVSQDIGAVQEFTALLFSPRLNRPRLVDRFIQHLLPENLRFGGAHIYREFEGRVELSPKIAFLIRNQNELSGGISALEYPSIFIFHELGTSIKSERMGLKTVREAVCAKLSEGEQFLAVAAIYDVKNFSVDYYGQGLDSHSYVKVEAGKTNDVRVGKRINRQNCQVVTTEAYDEISDFVQTEFNPLHEY